MLNSNISSENIEPKWNYDYSFYNELLIPIDTSKEQAKFQPIDIHIDFENSCWAKNEDENSVRAVFQKGGSFVELESQIYDLNFSKDNFISSCNLVFLIPEEADGSEKYYIYYDDEEKSNPGYKDYVDIEDSYYRYEPIRGVYFESWYYKITQEDYIQYAVVQKGNALNIPISQQVTKFKESTEFFYPKNSEHVAYFNFNIWVNKGDEQTFLSTSQKLASKDILVDGNLMVQSIIVSESENGEIRSTNTYKYYYCPTEHKRIYVHAKHEIIDELPEGDEIPIAFGLINKVDINSPIDELNSGEIPPYIHFYSEKDRVITYDLDTNPENIDWHEMISAEDDYDIGDFAWISVDHGEKGNAQGLIFDTNQVVKSGSNEYNGIEISLLESNHPNLPNLNVKFANIYLMRNRFEHDNNFDDDIPRNLIIEYNANFFSTENGGYKEVEEESAMYQTLIKYQTEYKNNHEDGENNKPSYSLKVYPVIPSSVYSKIYLSLVLLKRPYISAELYNENKLIAVSRVGWVKLNEDFLLDLENTSFFSKAIFKNLEKGKYLVKIFANNVIEKNNREFIGYKIVDLTKDESFFLECRKQGNILYSFIDQNNNAVENVEVRVKEDGVIIESKKSDANEKTIIGLPCLLEDNYNAEILYDGFLIEEEQVKLGDIRSLIPYEKDVEINLYNLEVRLRNNDSFSSYFKPELYLKSQDMKEETRIDPIKNSNTNFIFEKIFPSDYTLYIKYGNFRIEKQVGISQNKTLQLDFYDLKVKILDRWDLISEATLDVTIESNDFNEKVILYGQEINPQEYLFKDLFVGSYVLKIGYKTFIEEKSVDIPYENNDLTFVFQTLFNLSSKIYDLHGYPLSNVKLILSRDSKEEIKETDGNGESFFIIPPGEYELKIYSDDMLIAKKDIDFLSEKKVSIITNKESDFQFIVLLSSFLIVFLIGLYNYKKRDFCFFVKVLIIFIAISSVILPWWSLSSTNSDGESEISSNMYLTPSEMVTFTSSDEIFYGEFSSIDEAFDFAIDISLILIYLGLLSLFLNVIFEKIRYKKIESLFFVLSLFLFISSISLFLFSMSNFSQTFVGGLTGSGEICVNFPTNNDCTFIDSNWGPGIGFYMFFISFLMLFLIFIYRLKMFLNKRLKLVYLKQ